MPSHRPHLEPHLEPHLGPHLGPRPPSRTTPIQTHRPSLASGRARMRSAVPTRFPGAHECTQSGPPPATRPSPPLPSLAVNWRGQGTGDRGRATSGPRLDRPPITLRGPGWATRHRPSPPLPSNAANWQRAGHIGIGPPGTWHVPGDVEGRGTYYASSLARVQALGSRARPRPQRQRPTPGSSSQLAKGLGRRESALGHL